MFRTDLKAPDKQSKTVFQIQKIRFREDIRVLMKTISAGRCIYVLYSVHGVEIFFYKLTKEMLIKNVCPDFFYISFQGKEGLPAKPNFVVESMTP